VRRPVDHLIGMNRVFAALLSDEPPPQPTAGHIDDDPVRLAVVQVGVDDVADQVGQVGAEGPSPLMGSRTGWSTGDVSGMGVARRLAVDVRSVSPAARHPGTPARRWT